MTLTLDPVILHTVVHHSPTSTYTPNVTEIEKLFVDRQTYIRTNIRTFETHLLGRLRRVDLKRQWKQCHDSIDIGQCEWSDTLHAAEKSVSQQWWNAKTQMSSVNNSYYSEPAADVMCPSTKSADVDEANDSQLVYVVVRKKSFPASKSSTPPAGWICTTIKHIHMDCTVEPMDCFNDVC